MVETYRGVSPKKSNVVRTKRKRRRQRHQRLDDVMSDDKKVLVEEIEQLKKALEQKDKALEQKKKALEQKKKALEQKDKALEQARNALEQQDKKYEKALKAERKKQDEALEQNDKKHERTLHAERVKHERTRTMVAQAHKLLQQNDKKHEQALEAERKKHEQIVKKKTQALKSYKKPSAKVDRWTLRALKNSRVILRNRTASKPKPHVKGLKHSPAIIVRVDYVFIDDEEDEEEKTVLSFRFMMPSGDINSETDAQTFIHRILEALLLGKEDTGLALTQNRRIAGIECDIVLMHGVNKIPCSVVEMKKNGGIDYVRAIFVDDEGVDMTLKGKVQGENLNQLQQILMFGFKKVYGVISDGNHSMITCTHKFSQKEGLRILNEKRRRTVPTKVDGSSPNNAVTFGRPTHEPDAVEGQRLYCSSYADVPAQGWGPTIKLLNHFVELTLSTVGSRHFERNIPLNKSLPARQISIDESDMFAHSTVTFKEEPDLWKCLLSNETVKNIFLFKHLGIGANGDCCLATTETGTSFCAVKFFAEVTSASDCAKEEEDRWNTIYKGELPATKVLQFPRVDGLEGSDACLLMPYLNPIDDGEDNARQTALDNGSVQDCLQLFASKGYHHNEVRWRHLGFFRKEEGEPTSQKVYLCDLGNLTKRDKQSDTTWAALTETWIGESLARLSDSANRAAGGSQNTPRKRDRST